jgi:putative ABC transport system permease protein
MKIYSNIKLTRKTLLSHKFRTLLSLSGITIGVAAVLIMVAIGKGAQREMMGIIEDQGTNLLVVSAARAKAFGGRQLQTGDVTTLTLNDSEAIQDECPSVVLSSPAQDKTLVVKYGTYSTRVKIMGTTEDYPEIRNFEVIEGTFFTNEDNKAAFRVSVIGYEVQKNLFEEKNPIGEFIRIRNIPFEVIGVLKPKGISSEGANEDNQIMIPIRTALRRVFNLDHISNVYVKVERQESMDQAEAEIRELLRDRHRLERRNKPDDFMIQNQMTVLEAAKATSESFTLLITAIASISLLVGGIGILAIMLLAVRERTNEIGLRMAVGARRKDILVQFISEALILGFAGGLAGVVFGLTSALVLGEFTKWKTVIPVDYVFFALFFSLSIGLFFGVYPARRASLLYPIDALRAE